MAHDIPPLPLDLAPRVAAIASEVDALVPRVEHLARAIRRIHVEIERSWPEDDRPRPLGVDPFTADMESLQAAAFRNTTPGELEVEAFTILLEGLGIPVMDAKVRRLANLLQSADGMGNAAVMRALGLPINDVADWPEWP